MFPESHSHAFGVTAYQAAWLKRYHPVEFFTALMNNQPMGFYPVETLKEDARRFGVPFLNPCVNRSEARCIPSGDAVLLGLRFVKDVGEESPARWCRSERSTVSTGAQPTSCSARGWKPQAALSLVMAGAFDGVMPNRREALWDAGLGIRPGRNGQRAFAIAEGGGAPAFADFTDEEKMMGEYRVMGIYPKGHVMEFVRPRLRPEVLPAAAVETAREGDTVQVAGWPVARQHPRGKSGTVFVTVEDETGDVQLILWPKDVRPGSGGSWRAACFWLMARSPAGTGPRTSSSPGWSACRRGLRCRRRTTGVRLMPGSCLQRTRAARSGVHWLCPRASGRVSGLALDLIRCPS